MTVVIQCHVETSKSLEENSTSLESAAQGAAVGAANGPIDDLAAVIVAWPTLSKPVKAGITAMVKAARTDER